MKRLILVLACVTLCACAQVNYPDGYGGTGKDDSNTANPIDALNPTSPTYGSSTYPGELYNFASKEDANRWAEQGFVNLVSILAQANACLGAPVASLTMTPTACVAYNAGYRGTETGSITFPNNSTCWVAMDENTSGNNAGLPNFTRVGTTHYLIDCIDVGQPSMAADSQLLMQVTTAAGAITVVNDKRTTAVVVSGSPSGVVQTGTGPAIAQYIVGTHPTVGPATVSGDATIAQGGALTVTKTNGSAFATSATTDTTNATNIVSGTLNNSRLPGTITVAHLVGSTDITDSALTPSRCVQTGTAGILTVAAGACATTAGIAQGGPLTQNLAAGGFLVTGLGSPVNSGDSLGKSVSVLNDLGTATASYNMGLQNLTNLNAPVNAGDALSEGKGIGNVMPAIGRFSILQSVNEFERDVQTLTTNAGATLTPICDGFGSAPDILVAIVDGTAFTIANCTGALPAAGVDRSFKIRLKNTSGGAAGVITLDTNYRTDTSWGTPANGKTRICDAIQTTAGPFYIGPCTADETN